MAAPTPEEKKLILQFRSQVEDVLTSEEQRGDPFLLRWIRARGHDLIKAEEMLRNSLRWREEKGVDKILSTPFDPWFTSNFPYWIDSQDNQGHPLHEVPLGSWDVRKAMVPGKEEEFEGHIARFFEDICKKIRESNEGRPEGEWPNTQWTIIVDWKGYSYGQLIHWKALHNTLKLAATFEAHYPELLYRAYFINCPSIFPLVMSLMKKILNPNTVGKITCYGGPEEWKDVLLEEVGEDNLGHYYGGKKIRCVEGEGFIYPAA